MFRSEGLCRAQTATIFEILEILFIYLFPLALLIPRIFICSYGLVAGMAVRLCETYLAFKSIRSHTDMWRCNYILPVIFLVMEVLEAQFTTESSDFKAVV